MVQHIDNALKCTRALLHVRPVLLRNGANSPAGSTLFAPKPPQTVDLVDRKAKRSGSFNELQLMAMVVVVMMSLSLASSTLLPTVDSRAHANLCPYLAQKEQPHEADG